MINQTVSHDRQEESLEAKARWFQSLSLSERMDLLCFFTDLILDNNPRIVERAVDLEDVRLLELDHSEKTEGLK